MALSPSAGLMSRTKLMMSSVLSAADCIIYLATHSRTSMFELTDDLAAHAFIEPLGGIAGQVTSHISYISIPLYTVIYTDTDI